jgi:hypothetical protein
MMSVGGFLRKDPTNPCLLPKECTHNAEEEEAAEERSQTAQSCAHFFDSNTIPGLHNCGSVLNILRIFEGGQFSLGLTGIRSCAIQQANPAKISSWV